MSKYLPVLLVATPLLLIAGGCYMIYPPAGLISLGLLWWVDLNISHRPDNVARRKPK